MDHKLESAIERFDIFQFLDENKINYETEGDNIGVDWIGISPCPQCDDEDNHFGINQITKTTHCWKCGFDTNLIGLISKIKEISYKKAKEFILEETRIDEDSDLESRILNILETDEKSYTTNKVIEEKELVLKGCIDLNFNLVQNNIILNDFFKSRKLTRNHIYEYDIKFGISGQLKGKLIFPIFDNNKLVAYQSRSLFESRYKITGPAHNYLYKINDIPKGKKKPKIILVEGILDRIRLDDFVCKFYKNKYFTTTPFSKILSNIQIDILNKVNPEEVIYMLDRDAWFDYQKTNSKLNCSSSFLILPRDKDPGSMNEKENLKFFKENNL